MCEASLLEAFDYMTAPFLCSSLHEKTFRLTRTGINKSHVGLHTKAHSRLNSLNAHEQVITQTGAHLAMRTYVSNNIIYFPS